MTTPLNKPVKRLAHTTSHRGRRLVVSLDVGDTISFREQGTRTWFTLPIDTAYHIAVRADVEAKKREKRQARKARRKKVK